MSHNFAFSKPCQFLPLQAEIKILHFFHSPCTCKQLTIQSSAVVIIFNEKFRLKNAQKYKKLDMRDGKK